MARYDQGGGCACGLQRFCDCGSGQQDGKTTAQARKAAGYVKTSDGGWRKDRSDPEGGIPGRYGPGDVAGSMRASPQARGRARRRVHEDERSKRRLAELDEQARVIKAVEGLSPRAKKVWERLKQGQWYADHTPTIQELIDAGLVVSGGRVARIMAAFVPVGTKPFVIEQFPENLP